MGQSHPHVIQILSLLRSDELDVNKARTFYFDLYFPSEAAAQAAADRLVTEGFTAQVSPATESRFPWQCAASHRLVPTDQKLSDLIGMLESLAAEFSGEYDGWGTFLGEGLPVGSLVPPCDLTGFERAAATYASAMEHYLRELHQILAHIGTLLLVGGLLKMERGAAATDVQVRLPWSYDLEVEKNGPGSVRYRVWSRSGRAKDFVVTTTIHRDGTLDYSFSQERLEELGGALRLGLVNRVAEYVSLNGKGRTEMLRQRRPSEHDKVDVQAEDCDDLEDDGATANAA